MQALTADQRADYVLYPSRCRPKLAHIRKSGPDSGPFGAKFRHTIRFRVKMKELTGFETIRWRDLTAAPTRDRR